MDLATLTLLAFMTTCAKEFNVDPAFVKAVAHVESRIGKREFRFGRLGRSKYAGPFGLHIAYVREKFGVDATEAFTNVAIGVRALQGCRTEAQKMARLKNYNKEFTMAYWREVCKAERKYRRTSP